MRRFIYIVVLIIVFFPTAKVKAAENTLAQKLTGRILLQVESYGRAWYVYPKDNTRYYLQNGDEAYSLMKKLSLGVNTEDLNKIPVKKEQSADSSLVAKLKGYILLDVKNKGEAWYLNPVDGLRYYLKDGKAAYNLMRSLGLGVNNYNLQKISMNENQLAFDPTFNSVAYASYYNDKFDSTSFGDTILPLASLTKLMTAMVVLDSGMDLTKTTIISEEQIQYPKNYDADAITSEVDLKAGDIVNLSDLWVSMLVASSNQSAVALADATGYSRSYFSSLMNKKAEELGLHKTKFVEMTGLDANNISTAKEMAIIANEAFSNSEISDSSIIEDYAFTVIDDNEIAREVKIENRNYSLLAFEPQGVKTGYLVEAQRNSVIKKNNQIIVVLHAESVGQRNGIIDRLLFDY